MALLHNTMAGPRRAAPLRPRAPLSRRRAATHVMAAGAQPPASRRDVLAAPALVAMAQAVAPLAANAKITPATLAADDFSTGIAAAHVGPLGGAVGVKDYKKFEPVIYGFIDGIKKGECPPWAKNASRGFLLREEGGNRAMLTLLVPAADGSAGLPFFLASGPKANPLWAEANDTWRDASVPIFATASEAFLTRGEANANQSLKGKYFGQYDLGWDGAVSDWAPSFTAPEANDFHNSVGIIFSVAHKLDTKTAGNTYTTKAKNALEVFHCFNDLEGAKEFAKVFVPDSPFFVNEKRYIGPYTSTIWKVVDDITFQS